MPGSLSHIPNPIYTQMKSSSSATSSHHVESRSDLPRSRRSLTGQHHGAELKSGLFNGLVNYIAEFIPALAERSIVLSRLTRKGTEFRWTPVEQKAFDNIKRLAQNTSICCPINYKNPDPIYIVIDVSNDAIGDYYGQGKDYRTMPPASFYS